MREVDKDARLLEQMLRLAVSVEGYVKRSAAIENVRRDGKLVSHEEALHLLSSFIKRVHDPLTWQRDVCSRADEIRVGQ